MKKYIILTFSAILFLGVSAFSQTAEKAEKATKKVSATKKVAVQASKANVKEETFRVWGNCTMCERAIENSTKHQKGVMEADWDKETDQFTVSFNPDVITLEQIKQQLADIGYDTETHRAKKSVYDALPGCCQYDRPEKL